MSAANSALLVWDFAVVKSNPTGTKVRFTITDGGNLLRSLKMIRAVLEDAFGQFLLAEAGDLRTNGDAGKGVSNLVINKDEKWAEITLTALTGIAATGTITVIPPYSDLKCCCGGRDLIGTGHGF